MYTGKPIKFYFKNVKVLCTKPTPYVTVKCEIILLLTITMRSDIFDITLKGKYLGKSTKKDKFIFENITYKVGKNIDVDSRLIHPHNSKKEINMQTLIKVQNDSVIPSVFKDTKTQLSSVRLANWNIPSGLKKCYLSENKEFNENISTEVKSKIQKFYPVAFEILTYQNYKSKYHTLLFMDEIEMMASLQKYAQKKIRFERSGEYLILKIPNLSGQRPSLIAGDKAVVTDSPNCTKKLGENGSFEGTIHKVLVDEIWLKFDQEFHNICGHWNYSVHFSHARIMYQIQHEVINEMWKKNRLGESFLFPCRDFSEYQPLKSKVLSHDMPNTNNNYEDNSKKNNNTMLSSPKVVQNIRWFNNKLNLKQKSAVINILKGEGRPMPYIIHGPPGTGKTITLIESIIQVYKEFPESKLLICAPTNSTVNILLSKLVNSGLFNNTIMKRLVTYNHFISSSYNMDYDEYCVLSELECYNTGESDTRLIKKEAILKLRIVLSTEGITGLLFMMGFKNGIFTHLFIDGAEQFTEPEMLLPLSLFNPYQGGQVILAGDPKQLGPVVMSILAKDSGLELSMLSRLINYPPYLKDISRFPIHNGYNPKLTIHLFQNYRALSDIVWQYNRLFYKFSLMPTVSNNNKRKKILLNKLNKNVHWNIDCNGPVMVHGIDGEDFQDFKSYSWFNPREAFQVLFYFTKLINSGISADDIGIITQYSAQVSKINELLKMNHPDITLPKAGTVEMFQGRERMIIIISIVRSKNSAGRDKINKFPHCFLVDKERTNVAISRAKALLIIIGDPSTILTNKYWKNVLYHSIYTHNYTGCIVKKIVFRS
ncbi:LOW QUALITY PROTEIN: probable RNA helicase armi [Melanaphis sacchari]|uniref:LOW QUALITY PROTEIN: probable RNA helicase armi n=1 Tax=Melanaphis sacchari TaxID=742174 RepID=UPI000DC12F6C|nr:LOW QUALITY PROTEIN: probable RNA helicase armi [Melanaphis sacchari]